MLLSSQPPAQLCSRRPGAGDLAWYQFRLALISLTPNNCELQVIINLGAWCYFSFSQLSMVRVASRLLVCLASQCRKSLNNCEYLSSTLVSHIHRGEIETLPAALVCLRYVGVLFFASQYFFSRKYTDAPSATRNLRSPCSSLFQVFDQRIWVCWDGVSGNRRGRPPRAANSILHILIGFQSMRRRGILRLPSE